MGLAIYDDPTRVLDRHNEIWVWEKQVRAGVIATYLIPHACTLACLHCVGCVARGRSALGWAFGAGSRAQPRAFVAVELDHPAGATQLLLHAPEVGASAGVPLGQLAGSQRGGCCCTVASCCYTADHWLEVTGAVTFARAPAVHEVEHRATGQY